MESQYAKNGFLSFGERWAETLHSWCLWILHYALYIPQFTDEHKYFLSNEDKLFLKSTSQVGKERRRCRAKKSYLQQMNSI